MEIRKRAGRRAGSAIAIRVPSGHLRRVPGEGPVPILSSSVDKNSAEFRANAERMRALVNELRDKRAEASQGGPARARERHVARGK